MSLPWGKARVARAQSMVAMSGGEVGAGHRHPHAEQASEIPFRLLWLFGHGIHSKMIQNEVQKLATWLNARIMS